MYDDSNPPSFNSILNLWALKHSIPSTFFMPSFSVLNIFIYSLLLSSLFPSPLIIHLLSSTFTLHILSYHIHTHLLLIAFQNSNCLFSTICPAPFFKY